MEIIFASATDKGITRDHNEDFYLNLHTRSLFLLADGMGGYQAGDVASRLGLESIQTYLDQYISQQEFSSSNLCNAVKYGNQSLIRYLDDHEDIEKMGTTLVGLSIDVLNQRATSFNIGDSRVYCFANGVYTQLTKDHSAEQEALPEFLRDVNESQFSSVLTKAMGMDATVIPDFYHHEIEGKTLFVMCSDGYYSMVKDQETIEILESDESLSEKATRMIQKANDNGGQDNITVTLIELA